MLMCMCIFYIDTREVIHIYIYIYIVYTSMCIDVSIYKTLCIPYLISLPCDPVHLYSPNTPCMASRAGAAQAGRVYLS
jgi:hypothetical protein